MQFRCSRDLKKVLFYAELDGNISELTGFFRDPRALFSIIQSGSSKKTNRYVNNGHAPEE